MNWVPIVFLIFKIGALAIAMFYAIKWHYDQGEKGATLAMLRTGVKMTAVFVLALLVAGVVAVTVSNTLGLDLTFP